MTTRTTTTTHTYTQTPELMINKYLTEAQSLAFGAMTSYDHGLATTDDDEHAFGSALWR